MVATNVERVIKQGDARTEDLLLAVILGAFSEAPRFCKRVADGPSQYADRPPDGSEGGIMESEDGLSQLIDPELFRKTKLGSREFLRNMAHPNIKTIRTAVVKTLAAEIDATLKPLAYERKGHEWRKASVFGRSILQLQKSRSGEALFINVGIVRMPLSAMSGTPDGFIVTANRL